MKKLILVCIIIILMAVIILLSVFFTHKFFAAKNITYNIRTLNIASGRKDANSIAAKNAKIKNPKGDVLVERANVISTYVENESCVVFNWNVLKEYFNNFLCPPRCFSFEKVFA